VNGEGELLSGTVADVIPLCHFFPYLECEAPDFCEKLVGWQVFLGSKQWKYFK
jgi:hypothetical protein